MPWVFVIIVMLVAALVAAAGDRMGHRAARRKLRIGKLRPRTVSTIIAVSTGVLISLATFGIVFAVWKDFREALLRYDQVKQGYEQAAKDLATKQAELLAKQKELDELTVSSRQQLDEAAQKLETSKQKIAQLDEQKSGIEKQLARKDLDLKQKERLRAQLSAVVKDLDKQKAKLEEDIEGAKILAEAATARKGEAELLLQKGSLLTYERVSAAERSKLSAALTRAVNRVNIRVSKLGGGLNTETEKQMADFLAAYPVPPGADSVIVLSAATNLFSGEALNIAFDAVALDVLIPAGAVVMDITVGADSARIQMTGLSDLSLDIPQSFDQDSFYQFMMAVIGRFGEGMSSLGFLPAIETGDLPMPFDPLLEKAADLMTRPRPYHIQIVSKKDANPLDGLAECEIYVSNIGSPASAQAAGAEAAASAAKEAPDSPGSAPEDAGPNGESAEANKEED